MYPGGKGKTFHHLVNLMPPHHRYIEPYLGSGAVLRKKLPATENIGNDLDTRCIKSLEGISNVTFYNEDALTLLARLPLDEKTLVYCDPPYVASTRKKEKIYKYEYSDEQHEQLLKFLIRQDCMVMISGYECKLYRDYLVDWNKVHFNSQTQNGVREETIWFNFQPPSQLHDNRYIGCNFRERQVIKRRQERLKRKFQNMDPIERSIFFEWLRSEYPQYGEQI
ncbi:DNA adenine methylase [Vibrio neptunius]|uniref:DNA adenine methylase n=1 Tax=Vibrio neptunius TaxID=170651 RepID=A0ABS3A3Z5_9VIBR|nr:DNA adenine methylase [Vibrio neptunius]MBN3494378.1 DNA adenine methylase [Vibrio neptunius]MBN3516809.1 DNA adenine methylase [Vibrio neptunius]MBN3551077.1 DNA adenine methylase [Vibrio neptunius]MBN3579206.1 DNA adenine methylase [Vibrio neptunius]MCH9872870.1 DNA adenine methylase [Vibrio neptunius]